MAYRIETFGDGDYNAGELGVSASVHAVKIEDALDSIFGELKRMKTQKVDQKTIERVKRMTKYHVAKVFENNEGHVGAIEMSLDEGMTPDRVLKELDKVTPERVLEVADKYLPNREDGKYVLYIRNPLKN